MGGRKNRGQAQHHRKSSSASLLTSSSYEKENGSGRSSRAQHSVTYDILEDFRLTSADLLCLFIAISAGIVVSVIAGLALTMTVSVHCEDSLILLQAHAPRTKTSPPLTSLPLRRVTRTERSMMEADNMQYAHHVDELGHKTVVPVVVQTAAAAANVAAECHADENQTVSTLLPPQLPHTLSFHLWTRFPPQPCPSGNIYGYNDWTSLQAAVYDVNALAAERFVAWSHALAHQIRHLSPNTNNCTDSPLPPVSSVPVDKSHYLQHPPTVLTICPGAVLRAWRGPILINAGNLRIECPTEDCVAVVGGSHFSFGPHAKHVVVRGFHFRKALASSMIFYHDGADVSFEDCRWLDNSAAYSKIGTGTIADVNSTSLIQFHQCLVGDNDVSGAASSLLSALIWP